MDIWIMDTEGNELLDKITEFHCFVLKKYRKNEWAVFVDKPLPKPYLDSIEDLNITFYNLSDFSNWLYDGSGIVCHNILGFDLPALVKLGYIDSYYVGKDHIDNKDIRIFDSLVMSRCLNPDRMLPFGCPSKKYNPVTGKWVNVGAHGLDAWGYRVSNAKPTVDDWRDQPIEVYVNRCIEDVKINEATFTMLCQEAKDIAKGGEWEKPLRLATKDYYLMLLQETTGAPFDIKAAEELCDRIDVWMKEIEDEVEPQLPLRDLPKSKQPNFPTKPFTDSGEISVHGWNWLQKLGYPVDEEILKFKAPPKTAFKQDGSVSKAGERYCESNGITDPDEMPDYLRQCLKVAKQSPLPDDMMQQALKDLREQKMPVMKEPMRISNQDDLKEYLVFQEGWVPLYWRTKDITRDKNKRNLSDEEARLKARDYIEEVKNSPYKHFIYDEYNINFDTTDYDKVLDFVCKKGRYLITSPKLKDDRGQLCENLENLKGDMAKQIVKWLSLRNRRSTIKAMDESKETGWLNNPRLQIDGRLGGAHSGITNTHRKKHAVIVNLPKADPDVLLGKEIRSLFYAPSGYKVLGYDAQALENRVAAMYAWKYDNGEYAKLILETDCHTEYAKAYSQAAGFEITRSAGKNITYGVLYGCQADKAGRMLGTDRKVGQKVIDAFWETNWSLKMLKDNLEQYWESTGKKYILGLDGRKIYTRSKHALLNCLFQSAGAIIMDTAGAFMHEWLMSEGLLQEGDVQRILYMHDEYQYLVNDQLITKYQFGSEEEAKGFSLDGKILSNPRQVGNTWEVYHSIVGELGVKSIRKAGEYYKSPLIIDAAYDVGNNLAETH